ncbi:MAG TPA: ROK family protein [Dehalococcoidales bacterium]
MTDTNTIYTLGVDVGGTKIDTALVDSAGRILASHYRLIDPSKEPQAMIADIIDSVSICLRESGQKAVALGIGIAGQIDKVNGIVRRSPNLPAWQDVPLGRQLADVLQIPVIVNNDARAITFGEWQFGAGRGVDDLVCLFVGTGIGGSVVAGGRLLEGCGNSAGELGHLTVVAGGRKCHCPNDGCLEAYAGGWAIAERARDIVRVNPQSGQTIINLVGDIDKITSITVAQAYLNGDALAHRLVKDTAKYLAAGLVSIVNAFNPCLVILGGSVILGLPELVPAVEKRVKEQALQTAVQQLRITTAALGNKAGVIGAAAMAREKIKN